jgi:hypothetical protein
MDLNPKIDIPIDESVSGRLQSIPEEDNHFDPLDALTKDEERECIAKAFDKLNKTHNRELELAKSEIRMPNQEYCVVSFVGEKLAQKTEKLGIKIWGVFADLPGARKYAQYINGTEENKDFDVYVMEMYCWTMIPPDPKCIESQEYHDNKLNNLIKTHKVEQYKVSQVFDKRKLKLMANKKKEYTPEDYNKELTEELMPSEKLPQIEFEQLEDEDEVADDAKVTNPVPDDIKDIFSKDSDMKN